MVAPPGEELEPARRQRSQAGPSSRGEGERVGSARARLFLSLGNSRARDFAANPQVISTGRVISADALSRGVCGTQYWPGHRPSENLGVFGAGITSRAPFEGPAFYLFHRHGGWRWPRHVPGAGKEEQQQERQREHRHVVEQGNLDCIREVGRHPLGGAGGDGCADDRADLLVAGGDRSRSLGWGKLRDLRGRREVGPVLAGRLAAVRFRGGVLGAGAIVEADPVAGDDVVDDIGGQLGRGQLLTDPGDLFAADPVGVGRQLPGRRSPRWRRRRELRRSAAPWSAPPRPSPHPGRLFRQG